jgi:predicted lipoprotein with Yx(FWY)xxD motif
MSVSSSNRRNDVSGAGAGSRGGRHRILVVLVLAATASATAGMALARPFTVRVAKSSVTNAMGTTRSENIVVNSGGFALYELSGATKSHPKCTKANSCFSNWPPAKVKSTHNLSKGPGVPGKLGAWRRDGFIQLTLNGHPLYRSIVDLYPKMAGEDGAKENGGTWHVIQGTT